MVLSRVILMAALAVTLLLGRAHGQTPMPSQTQPATPSAQTDPQLQTRGGLRIGLLSCREAGGWGLVFRSTRDLTCLFSPARGEPPIRYTGQIRNYGIDIGYKGAAVILWGVVAPTTNFAPGDLEGEYLGVSAGASVGFGAGANILVGGSNRSFSLQPLSIEGESGLNFAAAITELTLKYQP